MRDKVKKSSFYSIAALLAVAVAVIFASYFAGAADNNADQEKKLKDCFFGGTTQDLVGPASVRMGELRTSRYSDWNQSISDLTKLFHETMNEKFNDYIKKSMEGGAEAAMDPNSQEAINARAPEANTVEEALKKCSDNDYANYSTYCVAVTLYANPDFGYKTYHDIMSCRKTDIFQDSQESEIYKAYNDFFMRPFDPSEGQVFGLSNEFADSNFSAYQQAKAISAYENMNEVDKSLEQTRQALDQTLSAYDQMKIAWQMHKRYMEIYKMLVKYRDYILEIRKQVESFPAKFIDASTTKCT